MQIIKKPSAYTFAGNCAKIEFTTSALAQLLLNLDGVELLRESYEPTAGLVTIDLTEILLKYTPSAALAVGAINIPKFSFTISNSEGSVSGEFFAVNGGHGASVDAQTFLKQNWLTWQPQSRTTSYHAPQRLVYAAIAPCSVLVKAYFADKSTLQAEHSKLVAGKLYTIDATFGTVRGLFSQQPVSFDIWVEGVGIKSYPQRYYLAAENKNSDVFLWRNSIGGIDTVAFAGDRVEKHKSDSSAALLDDAEIEYDINAKKSFLKYTGYFDNENERLWVLDFFNSRDRHHLDDGVIRRVVVTKPKLEHTRGELAGYEFEFAHSDQSVYLNLPKVETPALLEIADPTGELFFLAPRLNQFAAAEIAAGDILIPCQYAGAEKWLYVAVADIVSNFGTAGGGGSAGPIRTLAPIGAKYVDGTLTITHNLAPADVAKFGTADKTGHAMVAPHPYGGRGDVDFAAKIASAIKLLLTSEASSPDYVKALTGFSLKKNEHGKWTLELDNISVRESLSVPEFIKNRITVTNNQMWIADNGIIDDVAEIPGSPGERLITVAQDKGGGSTFVVDDLLKGLFLDEKNGSLNFQTVLLTVRQVISPYVLRVSVDENTPPPRKELIIVRAGNRTNSERQNSIFIDAARPAMFFYVNVDSHQISERNIAQATGNLQGMNFGKITDYKPITERFSSIMRGDNYIVGRLMGLSGDGLEYHIPVDRGEWAAGTYYHYDRVSCDGAMWDCAVPETTTRPTADALDWTKRVSKGEPGAPGDVGDSVTGKMLYRDPEFRKGVNGCYLYDYFNRGNVTLARIEKPADCPTTSTHCVEVRITGSKGGNLGGFVQTIQSRANAVFLQKFIAKIPVGYELWALANSIGDGTTDEFITPNVGTGKYETYLRKTVCGATGTFGDGGYVRLIGNPIPTPANPVVWQVASCTCYDLTDSEKYDDAIEKAQTDTDRANALLSDIANDDKLISSEKSTTKKEWDAIVAEYPKYVQESALYSIDDYNYNYSYKMLSEYIAPLLSAMQVTSDIVGTTFRDKFNNYYSARQNVVYLISVAVKNATLEALAESNRANAQLAEIASDGKLTPSEKQQTAIEWSRIRAEQSKNTDTATTLHVSTGEVLAAFNTLNSYITPLLANLSVTSDINGGQFRATFAAWYEKNIALVNAISKANADKAADEIEIGGVNLISKSAELSAGNDFASAGRTVSLKQGQTYTLSYESTNIGENATYPQFYLWTRDWNKPIQGLGSVISGGKTRTVTCTLPDGDYLLDIYPHTFPETVRNKSLWKVKFESGNKKTDWSPAPNEIDSAMTDLSKTFGFSDIATLSEWLSQYPGNVPFYMDPVKNQTFLSNAVVKNLAVDTSFINTLMANEAFISKLTVGSLNTKPTQQTNRVEIKEDAMTVYDAGNRAVSTFNGSPMPALSEFEQDGASGSVSGGGFVIGSAASPDGATRTVCSLSVTRNNASLRVQSSISLIFDQIGGKPLGGEAKLELWRGGSRYTDIASAIDENTIGVDRSVNVEVGDYSLVLRCIRWSGQWDSEIRGNVGSTTMSFAVADDALKTMFGANGYGVRANKFSYEHTVFNPSTRRLEKTYKGDLNMSGVLAKARIDASGTASRQWGTFRIDRAQIISGYGNRRVWHNTIAGQYSAFCSAYGGGATPVVHGEYPDFVDVYAEGAFNIMLVGSNE